MVYGFNDNKEKVEVLSWTDDILVFEYKCVTTTRGKFTTIVNLDIGDSSLDDYIVIGVMQKESRVPEGYRNGFTNSDGRVYPYAEIKENDSLNKMTIGIYNHSNDGLVSEITCRIMLAKVKDHVSELN